MTMSALHDSPSPNTRRAAAPLWASWMRKFSRLGEGARAGWQRWQKTWARLQRMLPWLGSRWQCCTVNPADWSRTEYALRLRQCPHLAAGDHPAGGIGLVVGIDVGEPVAVVHHHGVGLLEAVGAGVGQPVEPLDD